MKKYAIINKAKKDNGTTFTIGIWFSGICVLIFALHWNFLYNSFKGPFELKEDLLKAKSVKKYFRANVPLLPIGSQKTGIKMFGGIVGDVETAKFMVTQFGDKFLIVKVSKDFTDGPVEGGLVNVPEEIVKQLSGNLDFYPEMLDCQISYILDTDLFMIVAVLVFPISLLIVIVGFVRKINPLSHKAISQFKKQGQPSAMVERIEAELLKLPHNTMDSSVFYSTDWIVFLEPSLKILKANDLIGFGIERGKNANESVALWLRGKPKTDTLVVTRENLTEITGRLKEAFPNRYKEDANAFKKEWNGRRKELEESFDKQ